MQQEVLFEPICQVYGECSKGRNKIGTLIKDKSSIRLFGMSMHSAGRGADLAPFYPFGSLRQAM